MLAARDGFTWIHHGSKCPAKCFLALGTNFNFGRGAGIACLTSRGSLVPHCRHSTCPKMEVRIWRDQYYGSLALSSHACEAGSASLPYVTNRAQNRFCREKGRSARISVIVQDGTPRSDTCAKWSDSIEYGSVCKLKGQGRDWAIIRIAVPCPVDRTSGVTSICAPSVDMTGVPKRTNYG